jgi:hypothetical protein
MNEKPIRIASDFGIKWRLPDGKLHREDGPAIEWYDGTKSWYLNGEMHREDGPAIEPGPGCTWTHRQWWLNGECVADFEKPDDWDELVAQYKVIR